MSGEQAPLAAGDIIEFTHADGRHTAEVMLVTDGGEALLDLFDGERPVYVRDGQLTDVVVFHPDLDPLAA